METNAMLTMIVTILTISLLGFFNGLFSYFLDYCFWEGSVFSGYLPFLAQNCLSAEEWKEVQMLTPEQRDNEYTLRAQNKFFFKMLGGCVICFNVWISLAAFTILNSIFGFGWGYFLVFLLISHFTVRKISH